MKIKNKITNEFEIAFYKVFNLKFQNYYDSEFGFDSIKFNLDLNCPRNLKLKDFINLKFGGNAVKLVERFLN